VCEREPYNPSDRYAVAVVKNRTVIGHLPRTISRIAALFLRRGGTIHCTVTGRRRHSADLPQGGLEIPCSVKFKGDPKDIIKLLN
jgi:hypothetical protein